MRYVLRGFKGPEVQIFDHIYYKKDKYFEKQFRKIDALNNVLNNIQLFNYHVVASIRIQGASLLNILSQIA